jgi:hypothetical protein
MSIRGSRSADFIGDYKRFDYAHDDLSESYLLKLKEIISNMASYEGDGTTTRTLTRKYKKGRKNKTININTEYKREISVIVNIRGRLEEIKILMKSINNNSYNDRINKLLLDPNLENARIYKNKIYAIQEDILRELSKIYEASIKHPKGISKIKHKPHIVFFDNEALLKMNISDLVSYVTKVKDQYETLTFHNIKKPSLNHLFNSIEKCTNKINRLRAIILLIQRDISELELMDFKAGLRL